ncbi:MAG: transcriptional repressor [Chloroflexi bacterium]|nr:transcriptional repressor [Chloroflexota bacterium]
MTRHPNLSAVIQRLEDRGHRVTAPRLAVLAAAADAGDQFSADEIDQRLPHVGRATVFRTLKLLLEMDVFCRVLLDDGNLRYRWSRRGHHHHLVCNECGAVEDFTACDVSDLVGELTRRSNFTVDGHWLEVYGRCGACTQRKQQPIPAGAGSS